MCLGLLVLAGCKTTAFVRVNVAPDGSGSVIIDVYLDAEAAAQVGDLSQIVAVDDLKKAGWKIIGPAPQRTVMKKLGKSASSGIPTGDVQIHLEHAFSGPDEANAILANLNGPDGPFSDVRLEKSSSLFSSKLHVSGSVDLHGGLNAFGDAALTKELGTSLQQMVSKSGGPVPNGDDLKVGLQVVSSAGQSWHGEMGNESDDHETVTAVTNLGGHPQHIDVTSTQTHWGKIALFVIAGLVIVAVLGLAMTTRRRKLRYVGRHERR